MMLLTKKLHEGHRNVAKAKDKIYFIHLHDIDKNLTQEEIEWIDQISKEYKTSYLLHTTKNGTHYVGLTPLSALEWANQYTLFNEKFDSYYAGQTMRLKLKEGEKQELIKIELNYGEVIPNLYNLYCSRFNLQKMPWNLETVKYIIEFEKYWSFKQ